MNKSKNLINSFKYAFCGIKSAFITERNMKIHTALIIVITILGIILKISRIDWIICIILFALVISAELMNTAIETVVDMVMPEINPKAKIAKDVAAAGVLVMAIASVTIGVVIFVPKIVEIIN